MRQTTTLLRALRRPVPTGALLLALATAAAAQPRPGIGLSSYGATLLGEDGTGHEGPNAADHFGFALAAGDFNGDGVADLVAGIPGNDCDFVVWDCGATVLRLGVPGAGLSASTTRQVQIASPADPAFAEFGASLAAGDFNGDHRDDLAVGMPGYGETWDDEGAVQIHHGDSIGLTAGLYLLHEGTSGVPGSAIPNDRFGFAMASGNFDGDGFDDLAIGIPGDLASKGMVTVAHGGSGGLLPFAGFVMREGQEGLPDVAEDGEELGYALAAGDFDGDGFDDLAIGVPSEDDVGAVLVVYGSPWSLIFADHEYFSLFDLGGVQQAGSRFGETLAAGDFNGDGFDDLAVGAPEYDGAFAADTGLVTVAYGSGGGFLPFPGYVHMSEASLVGGSIEQGDRFGSALAAGDFDGDGVDDLAIGIPGDNYSVVPSVLEAGAVVVVLGRHLQLLPGAARFLAPGLYPQRLIPDVPQGSPAYGAALAAGDFDGNGFADLAVGAPDRDLPGVAGDVGGAAVLYGELFLDGFEAGDAFEWSAATP